MAIQPKIYGLGMKATVIGSIDWDTDTLKWTLHTSTYTPNQDTHDFYDDATNELATAVGYTSGGLTASGVAVTYDSASQQVRLDFTDPAWTFTGAGPTWRYMVLRKSRGGAASADELLAYVDWGASVTNTGSYSLVLDPTGLLYIDVT